MTAADFAARHPKPWHFVICKTTFSLRDANGRNVGSMQVQWKPIDVPQKEWNRHIANALSEKFPVIESSETTDRRRGPIEQRLPALRLPAAEPPLEARKASATPETPP